MRPGRPPVFPQSKGEAELHERNGFNVADVYSSPYEKKHEDHPADCLLLAGTNPNNKWVGLSNV